MAESVKTWIVPAQGEGRPDYTGEQYRSATFARYNLRYLESFRIFARVLSTVASLFPHVRTPLVPGETVSLIEVTTGVPMPATIPADYAFRLLSDDWSFNARMVGRIYYDTMFAGEVYNETLGYNYVQRIQPYDTGLLGTTVTPHLWDERITNIDVINLSGFWGVTIVQYPTGTKPLPKTKTVQCRKCGKTKKVSNDTTEVKCKYCGETTRYQMVVDWRTQRR